MKHLSAREMASLDRAMVRMGIDVPRMMELAGLFVAITASRMLKGRKRIIALTGTGNNGGDALVAARHLINWGYKVDIAFAAPVARLKPIPMQQWRILLKMGVKAVRNPRLGNYGLIIDGLLGYSMTGAPRRAYAALISAANSSGKPILAIDVPSGLDATTGRVYEPCIKASTTLSLTVVKDGLLKREARKYSGKILVSYMTVPEVVGKKFGINNSFSGKELISRLR